LRSGQGEEEAAALAGFAFSPDAAAMLFDDAAAEGQAQAGAAQGAGVRGVALLEAVEDAFQFSGAMPRPWSSTMKQTALEPVGPGPWGPKPEGLLL